MTKRNLNGFLHLAHAREREKPANPPDPPEPGDDKLARLPEPDSDDRQGRVYRAPSEAGPGNDINAGSPGFQKAPTRDPASLVAGRALAGRRPACDTAIVGHRNFAIEQIWRACPAHAEARFIKTALGGYQVNGQHEMRRRRLDAGRPRLAI